MFDRLLLRLCTVVMLAACAACSHTPGVDQAINALSPYKMDIVQGNVVTREQLAVIKVGMPRALVRNVLGTPLLTSVFHAQRWDYVFTLKSQSSAPQDRRVTVFFQNDVVEKIEADELPSEAEFVATLRSKVKADADALPELQASPASLEKFPPPAPSTATPAPAKPAPPTIPSGYTPLEPLLR